MYQITELDLDVVAQNIYDLYVGEDRKIGLDVVRERLEEWSIMKYPIYEKMGKRLRIESEEQSDGLLDQASEFRKVAESLFQAHFKKCNEDLQPKTLPVAIARIHSNLRYFEFDLVKNMITNTAFNSEQKLERFINHFASFFVDISQYDITKVMKQKKLTKQITLLLQSRIAPFTAPPYWIEEDRLQHIADAKLEHEIYAEAFPIVISEVKQALHIEDTKTPFVLSIHPYDFVTLSVNTLNWTSCFHPQGGMAKSPFSVMVDDSTLIGFIPSKTAPFLNYEAFENNKKMRAMLHFDITEKIILVNKVYPSNFRSFSAVTSAAVGRAKLIENPVLEEITLGYEEVNASASMYNDLSDGDFEVIRPENFNEGMGAVEWTVGVNVPCMVCGSHENTKTCRGYTFNDDNDDPYQNWECESCKIGGPYEICERCSEPTLLENFGDGDHEHHCLECAARMAEYPDDTPSRYGSCNCEHCIKNYEIQSRKRLERKAAENAIYEAAEELRRLERETQNTTEVFLTFEDGIRMGFNATPAYTYSATYDIGSNIDPTNTQIRQMCDEANKIVVTPLTLEDLQVAGDLQVAVNYQISTF